MMRANFAMLYSVFVASHPTAMGVILAGLSSVCIAKNFYKFETAFVPQLL